MVYRLRRKYFYRTRGSRRFLVRKTSFSRKARSNRIYRRFVRRTAARPELKYTRRAEVGDSISANSTFTTVLTPATLAQGTTANTRIGQQVKFTKVDVTLQVRNNSLLTPSTAPNTQSSYFRIVIWTPRIDITTALTYMNSITTLTQIDWNVVTIVRDKLGILSPPYLLSASAATVAGAVAPYQRIMRFAMKHPRKVKFGPDDTGVDEEKYALYITYVAGSQDIFIGHNSRTHFLDA